MNCGWCTDHWRTWDSQYCNFVSRSFHLRGIRMLQQACLRHNLQWQAHLPAAAMCYEHTAGHTYIHYCAGHCRTYTSLVT